MTAGYGDAMAKRVETPKHTEVGNPPNGRAAWNVPEWSAALTIGRATYYTLKVRPRSIRIGKRVVIIESPADYAIRIAAMQGAAK